MQTIRSKWRLLALMLPVALVIAAVAFFMGGSSSNNHQAFAGVTDTSGVTCTDVWLGELNNPTIANSKPAPIGDPPPPGGIPNFHSAIALTYSNHNITTDETVGVTQSVNSGIQGVIAGAGTFGAIPLCASVNKVVATVSSVTQEPAGGIAIVAINATGGNPPMDGMVVYWDSSTPARQGYYVVTSTDGSSTATLQATFDLCNATPGAGSALGSLHACLPVNKGFSPPAILISASQSGVYGYTNAGTITGGVLDPGTAPRLNGAAFGCGGGGTPVVAKACTSVYVPGDDCLGGAGAGCSISISCVPGTGAPEDPQDPPGDWTRTETRTTAYVIDTSHKTPSYGVTQFFTPVDDKTCANNGNTLRSTTYNVVWSTDSAAIEGPDPVANNWNSDWDKDGCLDWEELQSPQPVAGGGRDAFNPYDCARTMNGIWTMLIVKTAISTSDGGNTIVPGSWWSCGGFIETASTMRTYCYRDEPGIDVNPDAFPGDSGDGLGGNGWPIGWNGMPPPPYGDVNESHDVLDVSYTGGTDTLAISGCLEDQDGTNPEGHVYIDTSSGVDVNVTSGYGEVDVWLHQTLADCTNGTPAGPVLDNLKVYMGIQADENYAFDSDLDGVPNSRELQDDAGCGRRDPSNRYDYYDVSIPKDGVIDLPNDILGVILKFAPGGYPPGDENWDRPPAILDNSGHWNRAAPDGVIDLPNDILGVILQFNPGGCGL